MLKSFFDSRRIAVIGAAREEEKVGNVIFRNLLGNSNFRVFPVNPKATEIYGVKCFSSVMEIPYVVDLVVICVKAEIVPKILEECGRKRIKNAIIISAGFSEAGNYGLNEQVREIAKRFEIEILGPNVLGILNPYKGMNATFFKGMPEKGKISFVSQSGALGTAVLDKAIEEKVGFASFISLGNMLQQDFISALEYLENDVYTEVIMLYIESLKEDTGEKFIEICKRISKRKRIIALKSGKTKSGEFAAKTHTSSMASPYKIYSGVFKQAGIIEAESVEEMFLIAKFLARYRNI